MDTTPFHLILFALDIFVLGGLFLWLRFRRPAGSERAVYQFERSLYVPAAAPVRRPSFLWDMSGVALFGGFGLFCFAVLCRAIQTGFAQRNIYPFNVGQCIAEGIAVHGTLFLAVVAVLLYRSRRRIIATCFGCSALVLAGIGFNMLYWEPYRLKVEFYEIRTSKVATPVRIVFISDIQTDRIGSHEIDTLKKIQQLNADLIILGGDYLQTFRGEREERLPEEFRQMFIDHPLEARLGVFAIAGNNSKPGTSDAELFRDTGIEFAHNTVIHPIPLEDEQDSYIFLVLLSLWHSEGDVTERVIEPFYQRQGVNLKDIDDFIVMVGHLPNYAVDGYVSPRSGRTVSGYRNADWAPDLMLAGHTHGGQVVLPFYGPIFHWFQPELYHEHVRQIPRNMWSGFFPYPNGGHLLITRGTGLERGWAPRIRLFCPPEISVIDIVPVVPE